MTKRTPAQYDWAKALFNDRRLSKHFTSPRRSKIKTVTLHHMTIVVPGSGSDSTKSLEGCYQTWQTRQASANYGVSGNQVWQYVSDGDAAWANASSSNHETLSIEHTNSTGEPSWKISDETLATSARLTAALHRLYGLGRPTRATVRMHRDYYATACPGPYIVNHLAAYIADAARIYDDMGKPTAPKPTPVEETPDVTTVKVTSAIQNLAGAAANAYGVKTAAARVAAYTKSRASVPVTSVLAQEVNTSMLPLLDKGLGMKRAGGGNGRYIWAAPTVELVAGGVFKAPAAYQGDAKQCAWAVYRTNGALSCEGSMHTEYRDGAAADTIRVQQANYFADQLLAVAKKHGVPLGNVLLAGDTNSEGMVVNALTKKGWRNIAAGTKWENAHTFMGWDGNTRERVDYALVYDGPGADPVQARIVAISHRTDLSDHAGIRIERHLTK